MRKLLNFKLLALVVVFTLAMVAAPGAQAPAVADCQMAECWHCAVQQCNLWPSPGRCQCIQQENGCIAWGGSCTVVW